MGSLSSRSRSESDQCKSPLPKSGPFVIDTLEPCVVHGVIQGESHPQELIPKLIDFLMQGTMPVDRS